MEHQDAVSPDVGRNYDELEATTRSEERGLWSRSASYPSLYRPSNDLSASSMNHRDAVPNQSGRQRAAAATLREDIVPNNQHGHSSPLPSFDQPVPLSVDSVSASRMLDLGSPILRGEEAPGGMAVGTASDHVNDQRSHNLHGQLPSHHQSTSLTPDTPSTIGMKSRGIDWTHAGLAMPTTDRLDSILSQDRTIPLLGNRMPTLAVEDRGAFPWGSGAALSGVSAATAIDLTVDEDTLPPLHVYRGRTIQSQRSTFTLPITNQTGGRAGKKSKKNNGSSADVQILSSHHDLTFWKEKHFQELGIGAEYQLAMTTALNFNLSSIQTVMPPSRYLQPVRKEGHRRPEFPGTLVVCTPGKAIEDAYQEHTPAKQITDRLVLWTDGSGSGGFGVVYRQALPGGAGWSPWTTHGYVVRGSKASSMCVEGLAILKAIELACSKVQAEPTTWTAIVIYTDALSFIEQLRHPKKSR